MSIISQLSGFKYINKKWNSARKTLGTGSDILLLLSIIFGFSTLKKITLMLHKKLNRRDFIARDFDVEFVQRN